jgi:Zn finger protein HypA/HybF involved in hydrogenase expression
VTKPVDLPLTIQNDIWQSYQKAAPPSALAYDRWRRLAAEQFQISPQQIGRIIAAGERDLREQLGHATKTEAQRIAQLMGLQLEDALEVLREQLHATDQKIVRKDGEILRDCPGCSGKGKVYSSSTKVWLKCPDCRGTGGNIVWCERPDNAARARAIELTFRLTGAMAPERHEIQATHQHIHFTDDELRNRLGTLIDEIQHLRAGDSGQVPGGRGDQGGVGNPKSHRRQALLADASHKNEG